MTGQDEARTTRSAILDAARVEIAETGRFTVNGTAARAGISRQAIHYHFGGARGIRAALAAGLPADHATPADMPTRERLLVAAERVLSRPGGGLMTIDGVAAEAGLTKGAVYHHFADRGQLLHAVAQRVSPVGELAAALASADGLPVRDGLLVLARAYYTAMQERADIIRHLAANAGRDAELGDVLMGEVIGRGAPIILAWLGRRIAAGELCAPHPSLIIQALFGPAFLRIVLGGQLFGKLGALGVEAATDHPDAYIDLLLHGIAGPAARPTPTRDPGAPPGRSPAGDRPPSADGGPDHPRPSSTRG